MFHICIIQNIQVLFFHLFKKLFRENKQLNSIRLLLFSIKLINPILNYPHINESYVCIYNFVCINNFIIQKNFNLFMNLFNSKAIKICSIITIHIQSYPMSSNITTIFSKIFYICPGFILGIFFLE